MSQDNEQVIPYATLIELADSLNAAGTSALLIVNGQSVLLREALRVRIANILLDEIQGAFGVHGRPAPARTPPDESNARHALMQAAVRGHEKGW